MARKILYVLTYLNDDFYVRFSHVYCAGDRWSINRHLTRLAVATGWWFVCTRFFDYVHANYGHCMMTNKPGEAYDRLACDVAGKRWYAFEVSGPAFLLMHCLLTMSEELRIIANWERIDENAPEAQKNPTPRYCMYDQLQILV
jgi:hypothetical protein